jgi:oligosaccharide repeat unit polymerase
MKRLPGTAFQFRMSILEVAVAVAGVTSLVAVQLGLLFTRPGSETYWASFAGITILLSFPLLRACIRRRLDPLEPVYLAAVAYFLYFVFAPASDLLAGEKYFFGKLVTPLVPRGSAFLAVGIVAMWAGYYARGIGRRIARAIPGPSNRPDGAVAYACVLGLVALVLFGTYIQIAGLSWLRFLSLGQVHHALSSSDGSLGSENPFQNYFYSTVDWLTVAFMLLYAFSRRGRVWLLPIFACLLLIYTTIGFRYRVLILVMAPVVYWYLAGRRRPGVVVMVTAALCCIGMIGIIGNTRRAFRTGSDVETDQLSLESTGESFTRSLDIYQPYLAIVDAFPDRRQFLWGSSFAYLLVQPIPRRLWPDKPEAPIKRIDRMILNDVAAKSGVAYPNVGEFYVNFGVLGIAVGMWLFGISMRILYEYLRKHEDNDWARIAYALALPFLVQVISRGYFVQIAQEAAFLFVPLVGGMWVLRRRARARDYRTRYLTHDQLPAL